MTDPLFTFEPEKHVYKYDGKKMTGCTTILGVLAKPQLVPWAARMACDYIRDAEIDWQMGISAEKLDQLLKEAQVAHAKKRDDGATKGTDTHAEVERYINFCIKESGGMPNPVEPHFKGCGIDSFIEWASANNIKFLASEAQFYSKSLWVAGTADLIFEKDGKRYLGDIKTYKKIWDRTPFYQCAGYALMAQEMGEPAFDGYCIINLPKERNFKESEDIKWSFDIKGDTDAFLACVTLYRQNANF